MAYTFQALQTEFYSRGFNYMDDGGVQAARGNRWLNDAVHMIDDMEAWPYLQGVASGAAPLTINDLGRIETVVDQTHQFPLAYLERPVVTGYWGDLALTGGFPRFFYLSGGNVVNVFPANTSVALSVRYTKFSPDMTANNDQPLMPDRYRMAIVEYAVAQGYRDKDNWQEAQAAQQQGDLIVGRMREFYALQSGAPRQQVVDVTSSEDW